MLPASDMPMIYVFTTLQADADLEDSASQVSEDGRNVQCHIQEESHGREKPANDELRIKTALLWSHHLLANSKRKDIQHWSIELQVWAVAKIGCVKCTLQPI